MNESEVLVIILVILLIVVAVVYYTKRKNEEGLSGFGVTSSLAMNNRLSYCQPGSGAFSGGCFLPHKVII